MVDVVNLLEIRGQATNLDTLERQVDRVTAAQQKAATAGEVLSSSQEKVSRSSISVARQLDSYTKALDPISRAQAQVERGERLVSAARSQGLSVTQSTLTALANARARHEELTRATNDNATAMSLNRMQMMESMHVAKSLADEIAAGGSPMRALAMEGGRIGEIFSMGSGGVGGTLKAFGSMLAPVLLNPLTATVAVLAAAGAAAFMFAEQQDKLARSLNGVGRAAGVSVDSLRALGVKGAAQGGISSGQGIDLAAQLAASGNISGAMMPGIIGSTQKYAHAFGLDLADAGKELANAFADPTKGAEELDKRLGFLDDHTKELIRSQQAQGDILGAQRTLFDSYNASVKQTTDTTWSFVRVLESAKGLWSGFEQFVGVSLAPSIGQKIAEVEAKLQAERARSKGGGFTLFDDFGAGSGPDQSAELEKRLQDLRKQQADEEAKAARQAAELEANRRSTAVGDTVRGITPEIGQRAGLEDRKGLLERALGDPEVVKRLGVRADEARAALERLTYQTEHWQTSVQKIAQDSALASKSSEAWTFAERAAVAVEQARITVLRESGDVAKAAASAEAARNRLIDEGNKKADEYAKRGRDELAMAGMSPYARGRQQILNESRDLREQYVPQKGDLGPLASPVVSGFNAVGSAATHLADVLTGAAGKIGGGAATSLPTFAQGGNSAIADYIRKAAAQNGIDPSVALRVWGSEGRGGYVGDDGSSFGPFQLHYGGRAGGKNAVPGLGDEFTRLTGLDASNPMTVFQQIDFAMQQASRGGWGAWHGAAKVGIGNWDGINGKAANDSGVAQTKSTAAGDLKAGQADRLKAYDIQQIDGPLKAANDDITRQNSLLRVNSDSFGKTTAEIAKAVEQQKQLNSYDQQGIPITDALRQKIADEADRYGQLAAAQERAAQRQKEIVGAMDTLRSASSGALSTFLSDLESGKKKSEALRDAMKRVLDTLQNKAIDSLVSSLFGGSGQAGGGLLGGLLSGLLGGVIPHANGGVMTSGGSMPLHMYSSGGVANSPQLAMFGEGRTAEAYVPLPDGRSIPVSLKGGSAGAAGGGTVVQPRIEQHFHMNGALADTDIHKMVQAGAQNAAAAAIQHVQRNVLSMGRAADARRAS